MLYAGLVSFIAAVLLSFGATASYAGTSNSSVGSFNHGGAYNNQATIYTGSGWAYARSWIWPVNHSTPSGYAGVRGRLFTSGGSLSCEGSTLYNTVTLSSGQKWAADSCQRGGGSWYSYGVTRAFNGSSWVDVYTFQSGIQNS